MNKKSIALLFYVSAAYDGLLGLLFLAVPRWLFSTFNVAFPNHFGYIRFPAMLLVIFGLMFLAVARKPLENRNLIPYGILLKAAYCSVTFWYWFTSNVPDIWKPFAVIDVVFGVLFFIAYKKLAVAGN